MTTKKREEELETITREIARMRDDIAALTATVQKRVEAGISAADAGEHGQEHEQASWADIQQTFEEVRARGEKALKDLAAEVEQHPLKSIAAAVGVGFILAKLFGRGRDR